MKKKGETELWLFLVHMYIYMDRWVVNSMSDKATVKL